MIGYLKTICLILIIVEIVRQLWSKRNRHKGDFINDLEVVKSGNKKRVYMKNRSLPFWFYFAVSFDHLYRNMIHQIAETTEFKYGEIRGAWPNVEVEFLQKLSLIVICCISHAESERKVKKLHNDLDLVKRLRGDDLFGEPLKQDEQTLYTDKSIFTISVYMAVLPDMEYEVYAYVDRKDRPITVRTVYE